MRQVLDSDRKIIALSLLKYVEFNAIESVIEPSGENTAKRAEDDRTADTTVNELQLSAYPSANDANVTCYVSGYTARSVIRTLFCDSCKEAVRPICSDELQPIQLDEKLQLKSF
jgi:hypothetical protein